ncbi:MAG TPA: hypothetical protein ENK02_07670 [Planctomycetes bacterium]|nr:hypothetical protein [Planctomycetota bacterium]
MSGAEERIDQMTFTLGQVWREMRVSCPHPDLLLAWKEGSLEPGASDYLEFHVNEAECPYCQAVVEDLERRGKDAAEESALLEELRESLLSSTRTFLRDQKK